ncbi:LamB/YcsF family protein [Lunatimonas salinarum]|uniref:LamB/YcsF family protein n=1 Tax=Lunatimonas salinarum TaxID=1774590 RepID=UPI001AE0D870|nr:LamB/YcsF family protein [Lunatimonas salinarum]
MLNRLDVNADLGEGNAFDAVIMGCISSCNIACGGHVGNSDTVREAILLAKAKGIRIGAHPSYPDADNFGREKLEMALSNLEESLKAQIKLVTDELAKEAIPMHHIKPHGALYNEASVDTELAILIASLVKSEYPKAKLYAPFGSKLAEAAQAQGIEVCFEAFLDRRYHPDLTLVKRSEPEAVLSTWDEISEQLSEFVFRQRVRTSDGSWRAIKVDTLCLHGDHPQALDTAIRVNRWLKLHGVTLL